MLPKKTTDKIIGGRPKGSIDAAAKDLERRVEEATQEVVKNVKSKKKESRSSKKRLQYGLLDDMINLSKKKYCVPDNIIISKECVRQRVKKNSMDNHTGHWTPMIKIEPYLIDLIIKLANMRTPITFHHCRHIHSRTNYSLEEKELHRVSREWKGKAGKRVLASLYEMK